MKRVALALAFYAAATGITLAQSCNQTAGRAKAAEYVRQCRDVSPATRPPCNAENACALIIGEIKRGCGFLTGADRPKFCGDYR